MWQGRAPGPAGPGFRSRYDRGMPLPAAFDLSGRVSVITGAGSPDGIGFATARMLAELGSAVMVSATSARIDDRVSELRGAGFDAAGFTGDLTDPDAALGLVSAALRHWGRLDIVVNNAGMISTTNPDFEEGTVVSTSLPTWQASLSRNLTTAFLVTQAALPAMTSGGWGRIIMVASVTGPVMAMRGDVPYATAKAGMVGLTRAAAIDAAGTESPSTPLPRDGSRPAPRPRRNTMKGWSPPSAAAPHPARLPPLSPGSPHPARPTSPGNAWSWTAATPSPSSEPHLLTRSRDRGVVAVARRGQGRGGAARIWARCWPRTPPSWPAWVRQENPSARKTVPGAASRSAGSRASSATAADTS